MILRLLEVILSWVFVLIFSFFAFVGGVCVCMCMCVGLAFTVGRDIEKHDLKF